MHIHTCCNNSHLLFSSLLHRKNSWKSCSYLLSPILLTFSFKPLHLGFLYHLWLLCHSVLITLTFLLSDLMSSSLFSFFLTCHWSASWYCWSLPPLRHSPWLPGPTFSWFKLLIHFWCWFFLIFKPPNTGVAQDSALKCYFLDIYWVLGGAIQSWVLNIISMLTAPVLPSDPISKGSSKLPVQHLHCRSGASLVLS